MRKVIYREQSNGSRRIGEVNKDMKIPMQMEELIKTTVVRLFEAIEIQQGKWEEGDVTDEQIQVVAYFFDRIANDLTKSFEMIAYTTIENARKDTIGEVEGLIAKEMIVATKEGQPTSRLTSLVMRLNNKNPDCTMGC